jgi:hypothetical protein
MEFNDLLTSEAHEEGAEINIVNPVTGKPTDAYIKVMGIDSVAFQSSQRKKRNKMIAMLSEKKALDETYEIDSDISALASITIGWRGIEQNGEAMKFTPKACEELYRKSPGLRQQVDAFVGDRRNFTKG